MKSHFSHFGQASDCVEQWNRGPSLEGCCLPTKTNSSPSVEKVSNAIVHLYHLTFYAVVANADDLHIILPSLGVQEF